MSVIRTDKWLEKSYDTPELIFKKLSPYFDHLYPKDIANILIQNGMYQKPELEWEDLLKTLQHNKIWEIVKREEHYLKQAWGGPNLPIFIFPSNSYNRKITEHYNGRTGLAFKDKLFLFISTKTTKEEVKALFTHEYHHACRLLQYHKNDKDYSLLDVIVLEGLAENAVYERFGREPLAPWTTYYSDSELEDLWYELILPNKDLPKTSRKAIHLLYGKSYYPNMIGYCVGYYLVKQYIRKNGRLSGELIRIPSEEFVLDNI